jgi:hypothetical protein
MMTAAAYAYGVSLLLMVAGLVLPFWPLSALGVLAAVLGGRWMFGMVLALALDLLWGAPTGAWRWDPLPMATLAFVATALRLFGGKYFLDRTLPDRL